MQGYAVPENLIALQVRLTRHRDPVVAQRARDSLRELDPRMAAEFLIQDASEEVLLYFGVEIAKPPILEAILRRRDAPRHLLVELAGKIGPELQEILLLREDAIVEEPAILDALERNPRLGTYARRRAVEIRQHLLRPPAPAAEDEEEEELAGLDLAEVVAAASAFPPAGEMDEETGLTEMQVRALPTGMRLRLARGASRKMRIMLIRDVSPRVALATISGNSWSEGEIEQVCRLRNIAVEVLDAIAKEREWTRRYPIVIALVSNPKTPVPAALRLLHRLAVRDLRLLAKDRNISDAVRSRSQRMYRIKIG
ncbi:MAG TPA: hypothetical protein VFE44_05230 [Thermoanaerobaculia bacterium]|nr:hypothetical protein [Thermoanaerobaculia bacterium]